MTKPAVGCLLHEACSRSENLSDQTRRVIAVWLFSDLVAGSDGRLEIVWKDGCWDRMLVFGTLPNQSSYMTGADLMDDGGVGRV